VTPADPVVEARRAAPPASIWDRIDALVDSAPGLLDLRAHGLHLLAARHWRSLGRPVPPALEREELAATFRTLAVPGVLAQVRAAYDGPIVLLKGPVVAALYPDPVLRPFEDLDLLVREPHAAQAALEASGFYGGVDPRSMANVHHHLDPLHSPNLPLHVELHSHPRWIDGRQPPSFDALLERAEPADVGVDGVHTVDSAHHAVLLAVHVWAHDPLTRLLRLVDVALMAEAAGREEVYAVAREWGLSRIWTTTKAIVDAILFGAAGRPLPLRLWGRGLASAREPTVLETHVARCLSPLWTLPLHRAPRPVAAAVAALVLPGADETWSSKLSRIRRQLARPSMRRSEHLENLASRGLPPDGSV
jgi:hypothetical protein